jgi:hypothetical protein
VKAANPREQLKVEELREAVADEERRLADLGEEARRAQLRLAALRSDLASATRPSVAQANLGAQLAIRQPTLTPQLSAEKIVLFRSLFRGRDDVYPVRFVSKRTGKAGYAPACANKFVQSICDLPRIRCGDCSHQAFVPVDDAAMQAHLIGKHVMGVYPLLPDETCWFLAIDFDGTTWSDDVRAFAQTCAGVRVPAVVERSRAGDGAQTIADISGLSAAASAAEVNGRGAIGHAPRPQPTPSAARSTAVRPLLLFLAMNPPSFDEAKYI